MWGRSSITWSPCEIDWLKDNRTTRSINESSLYLAKSRAAIQRKLDELDGKEVPKTNKKGTAIGKRMDILKNGKPCFFRSGWEANMARSMTYAGEKWEYEPKVFFFDGVKNGTVSYCPDFKMETGDGDYVWIEVKGFLDSKGRTQLNRFKKYHPAEFKRLRAVVGTPGTKAEKFFQKIGVPIVGYMREMTKTFKKLVPAWE